MSHAGSAGPTVDRLSDANPFVRNKKKEIGAEPVRYTGGYTELPQSESCTWGRQVGCLCSRALIEKIQKRSRAMGKDEANVTGESKLFRIMDSFFFLGVHRDLFGP